MKKMIKMSLVAAVAVTGLSSTVAAKPLAEAIKDVDVSGSVVYRYDDKKQDNASSTVNNNYKIGATLKSKVNDIVTATVRVVTDTGITGTGNFATRDTSTDNDANPQLVVNQANFTAKVAGATVIAGKQGLTTPWTVAVDSDGQEQTGTGLLALVPAGPVTIAAAVFNQTNLDDVIGTGTENVTTVGVLGKAGAVSFDAWYLDLADTFDTMTLGAKAKVANISLDARYASLDTDASGSKTNSMMYIKASTKVAKIGLKAQFAVTDKDGGLTALDQDAKTTTQAWNTSIHKKADATFFHVAANTDVMSGLNAAVNFATVDYKESGVDMETTEMFAQLTHKMGKNLSTYFRYGMFTTEASNAADKDFTRGRLQVEYKF